MGSHDCTDAFHDGRVDTPSQRCGLEKVAEIRIFGQQCTQRRPVDDLRCESDAPINRWHPLRRSSCRNRFREPWRTGRVFRRFGVKCPTIRHCGASHIGHVDCRAFKHPVLLSFSDWESSLAVPRGLAVWPRLTSRRRKLTAMRPAVRVGGDAPVRGSAEWDTARSERMVRSSCLSGSWSVAVSKTVTGRCRTAWSDQATSHDAAAPAPHSQRDEHHREIVVPRTFRHRDMHHTRVAFLELERAQLLQQPRWRGSRNRPACNKVLIRTEAVFLRRRRRMHTFHHAHHRGHASTLGSASHPPRSTPTRPAETGNGPADPPPRHAQ